MPRSGILGTYSLPGAQATQVAGTPIPSAVNNQGYSDIEQTFNTLQPIAYGGTNASTPAGARTNLGLEIGVNIPSLAQTNISGSRNRVVNGSMRDSQENGNNLGTTSGYCPADQWFLYFTSTGAGRSIQRIQQRTLAGSIDQLEYKCTLAKAVLGTNDSELITQPLEGSNVSDSAFGTAAAKPFVDRFQVQLPAGTYHVHYANSAGNRHCAVPFVISAGEANTPVVRSIVVPADTGGTWLTGDGVIGIVRDLVLAAGSNFTGGTASTWGSTQYYAATSQANILSSTSNVARLADVGMRLDPDGAGVYGQFRVGEVGTVYRSERYLPYFSSGGLSGLIASGQCYSGVQAGFTLFCPVKPSKPATGVIPSSASHIGVYNSTGSGVSAISVSLLQSVDAPLLIIGTAGGLVAGNASQAYFSNPNGFFFLTGCRL